VVRKNVKPNKEGKHETARQNEPDEGRPEEEKCQKKPEKVAWGQEVFHLIIGSEIMAALL
jgi:hypothetical protein